MVVLHVMPPSSGGMRRHVLTLLANLNRERYRPVLCRMAPGDERDREPVAENVSVLTATGPMVWGMPSPWVIKGAIGRVRPDLIHCHGGRTAWAVRAALSLPGRGRTMPIVYTVHGASAPNSPWARPLVRGLERGTAAGIAAYLPVSRFLADTVINRWGVPPQKVQIIPNGIVTERFRSLPGRYAARRSLGLDPGRPVVTLIGRLSREKGPDLFLQVASALASRKPWCQFLVAGDGPERRRLEGTARGLGLGGKMLFTGHIEDVRPALAATDVIVLPSRSEGQSLVLLEAMAAGRAVVAAAVGGMPEVISHERNGMILPPGDTESMAASAGHLLENEVLRQRLGAAAQQHAAGEYDAEAVARRVEKVYDAVTASVAGLSAAGV